MAVDKITYNGTVYDLNNVKQRRELYKVSDSGDKLKAGERHTLDRYMTDEDIDAVEYDLNNDKEYNKTRGEESIGSVEEDDGTKKNAKEATNGKNDDAGMGAGGNAAVGGAAAGATGAAVMSIIALNNKKVHDSGMTANTNGIIALVVAGVATLCGLAACVMSGRKTYDPGSDLRNQYKDKSGDYNGEIDAKKDTLDESMGMMNDDIEGYKSGSEELTVAMNQQAGELAIIRNEIAAMEAAGDIKGAAEKRKELQALQEMDFSDQQAELDETKENLADYTAYGAEAEGVHDSAKTVQEFLQFGDDLATTAKTAQIMLYAGAAIMGIIGAKVAVPKLWFFGVPVDGFASVTASLIYFGGAALMGLAAKNFGDNAKFEEECGSAGDGMVSHVNALAEMIPEQQAYVTETEGIYNDDDTKQGENRQEGQKNAEKVTVTNEKFQGLTIKPGDKSGDKSKDKPEGTKPTTTGGGIM